MLTTSDPHVAVFSISLLFRMFSDHTISSKRYLVRHFLRRFSGVCPCVSRIFCLLENAFVKRSQLLQFSSPVSARLLQFCSPVSVPPRECTRVEQTRFVFLSFFGSLIFVNRFRSRLPGYILWNTCIMLHDYVLHPSVFSFSGSPSSYARAKCPLQKKREKRKREK